MIRISVLSLLLTFILVVHGASLGLLPERNPTTLSHRGAMRSGPITHSRSLIPEQSFNRLGINQPRPTHQLKFDPLHKFKPRFDTNLRAGRADDRPEKKIQRVPSERENDTKDKSDPKEKEGANKRTDPSKKPINAEEYIRTMSRIPTDMSQIKSEKHDHNINKFRSTTPDPLAKPPVPKKPINIEEVLGPEVIAARKKQEEAEKQVQELNKKTEGKGAARPLQFAPKDIADATLKVTKENAEVLKKLDEKRQQEKQASGQPGGFGEKGKKQPP